MYTGKIMNNSNDLNWDQTIWQEMNDAIVKEVAKVRTPQKVFPTVIFDNEPTEVQKRRHLFRSENL